MGKREGLPGRRQSRPADPFAVLGLPAQPGLTDADVRSAWRRIAAATHPDRADGGEPARFATAAAAYTVLRTPFGRNEALADMAARPAGGVRGAGHRLLTGRLLVGRGAPVHSGGHAWRGVSAIWWRVRRGRWRRLVLRATAGSAMSAGVLLVAGAQPATPALITGALTWFALTARHDLAPRAPGG